MNDTIDLLEAIGSDASLRYAPAEELNSVLEQAQVSAEFGKAVASGDGAQLRELLGCMRVENAPQLHAVTFLDPG
ncbi:hypothetical protein [Dyella agri]|uniref:Uncharacterized protein n=1 Tax=Dyella agri TaxID=1926869 RepID=A0ABW8KBI5_9GAMM